MHKFLVVKHGNQDGRTWAVAAAIGDEPVSDRNIMSLRSLDDPGVVAPEPANGAILSGYMVRSKAHVGKGKDGQPRDYPDSYTLFVETPKA